MDEHFDALHCPNRAVPDRGSVLKNNQLAFLHNILSVVGVFWTLFIHDSSLPLLLCVLENKIGKQKQENNDKDIIIDLLIIIIIIIIIIVIIIIIIIIINVNLLNSCPTWGRAEG